MSKPNCHGRLALFTLSGLLVACISRDGPCWWDAHQDRETGMIEATSRSCDGVAKEPAVVAVRYHPTNARLELEIDSIDFSVRLAFDRSLPDGTYPITAGSELSKETVTASGANVTGTFTFSRSRDIPFVDLASPEVKTYQSTLDATFDVVAVFPHPDPSMGVGCRLETGAQHVVLLVSGPVVECQPGFTTGH